MEHDTTVIFANRRWLELYHRCSISMSLKLVVTGISWCGPSVRFMHDQVKPKVGRAWFPVANESVFYYMDLQREAHINNMNLGVDLGSVIAGPISGRAWR